MKCKECNGVLADALANRLTPEQLAHQLQHALADAAKMTALAVEVVAALRIADAHISLFKIDAHKCYADGVRKVRTALANADKLSCRIV